MRLSLATCLVGCLVTAIAPGRAAGGDAALGARLARVLEDRALRGARVGALVVEAQSGDLLFARNPDRALIPASNQKILTAIAVLDSFGPAYRFITHTYAAAPPDAEGAVAYLAVRAEGDPSLTSEDWWRWASQLRRAGVRRVSQGLILDDSAFDGERWHPSWGEVSHRAYHAPVGALTANYGAFAVELQPGARSGDPVRVAVEPPVPYLRLVNRASTGPPARRCSVGVTRQPGEGEEQVVVSGRACAGAPARVVYRSVLDPSRYADAVIRMQLEANGIRVEGETRFAPVPELASEIMAFEGKPLAEIVRLFVKFSNNGIAEALVKAMGVRESGGRGSWASGLRALRERLAALGLDTRSLRLVDGSGLSYENRVTARALVAALRLAKQSFRFGPEFVSALPIAAADGTLEDRAEDAAGVVRAKTGLLNRVTSLSGYAAAGSGRERVFSILVNGYRASDEQVMAVLDRFVTEVAARPGPAVEAEAQELRSISLVRSP